MGLEVTGQRNKLGSELPDGFTVLQTINNHTKQTGKIQQH